MKKYKPLWNFLLEITSNLEVFRDIYNKLEGSFLNWLIGLNLSTKICMKALVVSRMKIVNKA